MAKETISIGAELLAEGNYTFTVVGLPKKREVGNGKFMRVWKLAYAPDNEKDFFLFPNQYYPFVLAIGGVKEGKDVEWDDTEVDGRSFSCDLSVVKSKDGKYDNYVFSNCEPQIPF